MGLFDRNHNNRVLVGFPVELLGKRVAWWTNNAVEIQNWLKVRFRSHVSCIGICRCAHSWVKKARLKVAICFVWECARSICVSSISCCILLLSQLEKLFTTWGVPTLKMEHYIFLHSRAFLQQSGFLPGHVGSWFEHTNDILFFSPSLSLMESLTVIWGPPLAPSSFNFLKWIWPDST